MLALNQNQPETALEILPTPDKHFSSVNIRLIALFDCGQYAEATEIIKNILNNSQFRNYKISENVVSKIHWVFDKLKLWTYDHSLCASISLCISDSKN